MIIGAIIYMDGLLVLSSAYTNEKSVERGPWEKVAFNFGGFVSSTNTSFRLGSGRGVDIDVEKLLEYRLDEYRV